MPRRGFLWSWINNGVTVALTRRGYTSRDPARRVNIICGEFRDGSLTGIVRRVCRRAGEDLPREFVQSRGITERGETWQVVAGQEWSDTTDLILSLPRHPMTERASKGQTQTT